jgi:type IV pilus assembly protein PilE
MRLLQQGLKKRRGMTLIELMIVVAIIGILASLAGVAYVKYIKSAKIAKLEQYAMEVASAQEQYKSQNSGYLDLDGTPYAAGNAKWEQLLGFSKEGLAAQNIAVDTIAGDSSDSSCGICEGADPSFNSIWYAVRVTQDFDTNDTTTKTTLVMHPGLDEPILLNEGE